ncbi:MAG: hypothetical protein QM770_02240 [Tepidisphaeraceae bacterium]
MQEAKLHDSIVDLANRAILFASADPGAIADYQLARAASLFELDRIEEAWPNAVSAFNVAPQKTADRAGALIVKLLEKGVEGANAKDAVAAYRKRQLEVGTAGGQTHWPEEARSSLGVYDAALAPLTDLTKYDVCMARGNLHLLQNQPAEAREAFVAAARMSKGKPLAAALEGIVKCRRADHASITAGNEVVLALQLGAVGTAALPDFTDDKGPPVAALVEAGKRLTLAQLPASLAGNEDLAALAARNIDRLGPLQRIAGSATPPDTRLVEWLKAHASAPTTDADRQAFVEAATSTSLTPAALIEFASELHRLTNDAASASTLLNEAASRVEATLKADPQSPASKDCLAALVKFREQYKDALQVQHYATADKTPVTTMCRLYDAYIGATDSKASPADFNPIVIASAMWHGSIGESARTISLLDKLDFAALSTSERRTALWVKSNAYIASGQPKQAIPVLLETVADETSPYRQPGAMTLFQLALQTGDKAAAEKAIDILQRESELKPEHIEQMRKQIDAMPAPAH